MARRLPKSRRHPQFWREAMAEWIPRETGSSYCWAPELGGFRPVQQNSPNVALRHPSFRAYADYMETPAFAPALAELLAQAAAAKTANAESSTIIGSGSSASRPILHI